MIKHLSFLKLLVTGNPVMLLGGICTGVWAIWCLKVFLPCFHGGITLTTHCLCSTIERDLMFGNALYQLSVIHCSFFWRFVRYMADFQSYPYIPLVVRLPTIAVDI